jgi:hypothetical protein
MQLVEIEIKKDDDKTVEEVDVLRGREILQRFSGKYGSICLVVRRPGASCLHVVTEAKTCVARFNFLHLFMHSRSHSVCVYLLG